MTKTDDLSFGPWVPEIVEEFGDKSIIELLGEYAAGYEEFEIKSYDGKWSAVVTFWDEEAGCFGRGGSVSLMSAEFYDIRNTLADLEHEIREYKNRDRADP